MKGKNDCCNFNDGCKTPQSWRSLATLFKDWLTVLPLARYSWSRSRPFWCMSWYDSFLNVTSCRMFWCRIIFLNSSFTLPKLYTALLQLIKYFRKLTELEKNIDMWCSLKAANFENIVKAILPTAAADFDGDEDSRNPQMLWNLVMTSKDESISKLQILLYRKEMKIGWKPKISWR